MNPQARTRSQKCSSTGILSIAIVFLSLWLSRPRQTKRRKRRPIKPRCHRLRPRILYRRFFSTGATTVHHKTRTPKIPRCLKHCACCKHRALLSSCQGRITSQTVVSRRISSEDTPCQLSGRKDTHSGETASNYS